jgi:hypothetical protein
MKEADHGSAGLSLPDPLMPTCRPQSSDYTVPRSPADPADHVPLSIRAQGRIVEENPEAVGEDMTAKEWSRICSTLALHSCCEGCLAFISH